MSRTRSLARTTGLTLLAALAAAAPAAAASITLQRGLATPITAGSPCAVEERSAVNSNLAYDPAKPIEWFGGVNLPARQDVVPNLAAGANSDFCIGFQLPEDLPTQGRAASTYTPPAGAADPNTDAVGGDDMRDVVIDLPRGFSGNLANFDACSLAAFGNDNAPLANCPDSAIVGEAVVRITTAFIGTRLNLLLGGLEHWEDDPKAGTIYRLEAGPNELGRLGIELYPALGATRPSKFQVRLVLAPDGSGRVRTIVENAPRAQYSAALNDIYTETVQLRMFGLASDHPASSYVDEYGVDVVTPAITGDFAENPTDCSTGASAHIKLTTYGGPRTIPNPAGGTPARVPADPASYAPVTSELDTPPFQVTGCDQLPFRPSVDVQTIERTPGTPTGVKVALGLGQAKQNGRLPALLKDAAITLPAGLELGAQAGVNGLPLCSAEQFGADAPLTPNSCPAATEAADLTITSPLIERQLVGKAYLGRQHAVGELPDLYLEAAQAGATAPDAPRIKLVGKVTASEDGRITTTFEDNPQLRFSQLELSFPGGDDALFSTPRTCGTHRATSRLRSYASAALVEADTSLTIDQGCELPAFAPTVAVTPADARAGASAPTVISVERPDRAPWLDAIKVSLPSGLLADLHVPSECGAAAAATGDCPQSARIATVGAWAGAGATPLPLVGQMFLTERPAGAVAGAVIVVRAKIGELDLGDVVVPGRIDLRPTDAGLDFSSDLPVRFRGLALQLQKVVVDLDRPGFALNPSACGPVAYAAAVAGDGGEAATPSGAVAYAGCERLPFAPRLDAKLTGDVKPGGHPGMYVEVTNPAGSSNLRTASVVLPQGVAADLKNVQHPCERAAFDAGACPAATKVGTATALVSITPEPVPGDVYLVRVPGKVLPGLGLNFTGRFAQRVMSEVEVNAQGRLVNSYPEIPDLPLRRLVVDIAGGPKGPLSLPPGQCAANTRWDGSFGGQGGQRSDDETGLRCAATAKVKLSDRGGLSLRVFDFGGRDLQTAKVTLPAGWSFDGKRAMRGKRSWARVTGATAKRGFSRRTMTVRADGASASTLRLKVAGSAIAKRGKRWKKARRVEVRVRYAFTDGAVQTQTIKLKAR